MAVKLQNVLFILTNSNVATFGGIKIVTGLEKTGPGLLTELRCRNVQLKIFMVCR